MPFGSFNERTAKYHVSFSKHKIYFISSRCSKNNKK